jgi:hypothetical protein
MLATLLAASEVEAGRPCQQPEQRSQRAHQSMLYCPLITFEGLQRHIVG